MSQIGPMWKKLSFIKPDYPPGIVSHGQLPTQLVLGDRVRVLFAGRNADQQSHVCAVDLALEGERVTQIATLGVPLVRPGEIGTFDQHGVFPSSIVKLADGTIRLYYIGWNQGVEAPLFYASIGIAESHDGIGFHKRVDLNPVMARGPFDPCLVTSPDVYLDHDGWRMTYVSGVAWSRKPDGVLQSHYNIKSARSDDGITWQRGGRTAIDFANGETNIARSSVIKVGPADYRMWYGFVRPDIGKYRIGYATSEDGLTWQRNDAASGIGLDDEHASESICYPKVFHFHGSTYMLYNGDGFGRDGFGVAIWTGPALQEQP